MTSFYPAHLRGSGAARVTAGSRVWSVQQRRQVAIRGGDLLRLDRLGPWGEPVLAKAAGLEVLDGAVGGVEPEPLGDPGRGATLRTPDAVGHGSALLTLALVALGGSSKATSLPARMRGVVVGKQCRRAPDRRATRHPAAVHAGRRFGGSDLRLSGAQRLGPPTVT